MRKKNEVKLAPVYDCGSSLSALASEEKMMEILSSKSEFDNRIYVGNKSAIKNSGKRITYFSFLNTKTDEGCLEALRLIVPRIDMKKIEEIIENTPYLTITAIKFHKAMLKERYEKMLLPAYKRASSL